MMGGLPVLASFAPLREDPLSPLEFKRLLTHSKQRGTKKRIDFALIKATERIFGIDNLNGWHRHPFGGVKQHEAIEEPTLEEVFSEIKSVTTEQGFSSEVPDEHFTS